LALSTDSYGVGTTGSSVDLLTNNAALTFSPAASDVTREYQIGTSGWTSTYTAPTADGSYTVHVRDTDTAGNVKNASLSFSLDTSADFTPLLSISTVGNANVFAQTVQFTLAGIDGDVNQATSLVVTVSDADSSVLATYDTVSGKWSADINGLDRGALTITAAVTDPAGNVAQASKTVYSSIGTAIAAAAAGSTVRIAEGTYQDDAFATLATATSPREIIINKGLTIVGLGDGNSANGQEVIINSSTSRTFVVQGNVATGNVSISGVKVVGGTEGVSVDGSGQDTDLASLTVTNSTFVVSQTQVWWLV